MPAAAVVRQRQGRLGGQVGRDEVPGCSGTDGISAPTFKGTGQELAVLSVSSETTVNMLPLPSVKSHLEIVKMEKTKTKLQ